MQSDSSSEFGFFFSLPVISRLGYRVWWSLDGFFSRLWIACDIGWWKVVGFGGVSWVFCFFCFSPERERERERRTAMSYRSGKERKRRPTVVL